MVGLRRSASTRQTRLPASASAAARFIAVVDLPSPETALVTAMIRGDLVHVHELQIGAQQPIGLGPAAVRVDPERDR